MSAHAHYPSIDCAVIGAGHAGLAAARSLQERGLRCVVVEQSDGVGAEWLRRPPHMRLFTPRSLSGLKGLPFAGIADDYPLFPEVSDYLERYRRAMGIEVQLNSRVTALRRDGHRFVLEIEQGGKIHAPTVILANGSNQQPIVPAQPANGLGDKILQITARDYRGPEPLTGRRIAVVGDGASGRQIALELAEKDVEVLLCGDGTRSVVPERIAGRSIFHWLKLLGIVSADRDSRIARRLRDRNPLPQAALRLSNLRRNGVVLGPRCVASQADALILADSTLAQVGVVIWCLGYQEDTSWNRLAPEDDPDWFIRGRGRTDEKGLFVIGRQWLRCRASELILGADADAENITELVAQYLQGVPTTVDKRACMPRVQPEAAP